MNSGLWAEIIEYTDADHITVQFDDGKYTQSKYCHFISGKIKHPNLKMSLQDWCEKNNRLDLLDEYDIDKNIHTPAEIAYGTAKKIFWKCKICGHNWEASPNNRTRNRGCPACKSISHTSFPEQAIFFYAQQVYENVENQYKYDNKFSFDVFIPEIQTAIEYDGAAWHNNTESQKRDESKNKYCQTHNIMLIRLREKNCIKINNDGIIVLYTDSQQQKLEHQIKRIFRDVLHCESDINLSRDYLKILNSFSTKLSNNSVAQMFPDVAKFIKPWNNNGLTAEKIPYASNKKIYFEYDCGHKCLQIVESVTLKGHRCGVCNRTAKKRVIGTDKNGNEFHFNSITEASKKLQIDIRNISACLHNKIKSAGGYTWVFEMK